MATPREYQKAGTEYFRQYYDLGVWKRQYYRGIRILKVPTDLWNYQEIFSERRIEWVVETGSAHGGSALYFADLLQLADAPGKVITIDIFRETVTVRNMEAETRVLTLSEFNDETAGRAAPPQPTIDDDALDEEISPELMYTAEFAIPQTRLVILTESVETPPPAEEESATGPAKRKRRRGRRGGGSTRKTKPNDNPQE